MKNILKYTMASVVAMSLTNCTGDFEDINTNPYGISQESLTQQNNHIGSRFSPLFSNIIRVEPSWNYQLQQNLNADVFSGYMTAPTDFAGNINNQTYALVNGWNGFIWSDAYDANDGNGIMPYAREIKEQVELSGDPSGMKFVYLSNIVKVLGMQRISDVFGPIRYSKFDDYDTTGEYDSQEEAYKAFFADLDEAIAGLESDVDAVQFIPFDQSTLAGDISKWRTFANSIRLRLAIRVSKVDPALAKIEGEKALSSPVGLMTTEDMKVDMNGFVHPIFTISNSWGDILMSAEMESILKGFNDNRITKFFNAPADPTLGDYKGIRMGIELDTKAQYGSHSTVGEVVEGTHKTWMTAAEVLFLKAEAALRGWAGAGDAKSNYEAGVRASFAELGASGVDAYLADATSTPADFVDAKNPTNNYAYPSDVTIAYNDAGTNEEQLEQIITQKWIAMFPDGMEAWSEFRRTGYPRVFPVVINNSGGAIDTDIQIRRINFVDVEKNTNGANVDAAISTLKGPDNGGTRLWWDTGAPNF
ncbi:RagB/SusD family nutrient uptake outer membrane protein [Tamlana sp. 2_MG-2023]|uniref:RagB/SusD family nutrient uptake outer membrane protein n=1 Tax=unclassified Tamlana TaxID=2614803 RepID=UPI0026E1FB85|nr:MULTISPECIES: RagB/SusD family nutrient uptake outer membrane protein [unclassified Tamlana]MDO6759283.1 RagB/SusD family nutrient uptake outer membrane protein [Tamlana sp. 2_MG-2023]MDO6790578.1 RagB/SusD family nutrient uptake outer membrane protein [Tamlana sp. 1_MG-2023]